MFAERVEYNEEHDFAKVVGKATTVDYFARKWLGKFKKDEGDLAEGGKNDSNSSLLSGELSASKLVGPVTARLKVNSSLF